jgi:hypothetical protein
MMVFGRSAGQIICRLGDIIVVYAFDVYNLWCNTTWEPQPRPQMPNPSTPPVDTGFAVSELNSSKTGIKWYHE